MPLITDAYSGSKRSGRARRWALGSPEKGPSAPDRRIDSRFAASADSAADEVQHGALRFVNNVARQIFNPARNNIGRKGFGFRHGVEIVWPQGAGDNCRGPSGRDILPTLLLLQNIK